MSIPYMSDILLGLQHNHWPLSTPRLTVEPTQAVRLRDAHW